MDYMHTSEYLFEASTGHLKFVQETLFASGYRVGNIMLIEVYNDFVRCVNPIQLSHLATMPESYQTPALTTGIGGRPIIRQSQMALATALQVRDRSGLPAGMSLNAQFLLHHTLTNYQNQGADTNFIALQVQQAVSVNPRTIFVPAPVNPQSRGYPFPRVPTTHRVLLEPTFPIVFDQPMFSSPDEPQAQVNQPFQVVPANETAVEPKPPSTPRRQRIAPFPLLSPSHWTRTPRKCSPPPPVTPRTQSARRRAPPATPSGGIARLRPTQATPSTGPRIPLSIAELASLPPASHYPEAEPGMRFICMHCGKSILNQRSMVRHLIHQHQVRGNFEARFEKKSKDE